MVEYDETDTQQELLYPIQVVSQRSGLSADVIRVWERRYQAVRPARSPSNQRLYSENDISRLALLRTATTRGRRISSIADLSNRQLAQLLADDEPSTTSIMPAQINSQERIEDCLNAILTMQPNALEKHLSSASLALGTLAFMNKIVSPLMQYIGDMWRQGNIRTCQEHMATAHLRSFLGQQIIHANTATHAPRIIISTPPNQTHELGALMSAVTAAMAGWNVIYLGSLAPIEEIAFAADIKDAKAVALGISYPNDDATLTKHLKQLRTLLPKHVAIIVGGPTLDRYRDALEAINAKAMDDLLQFSYYLDQLR